MDERPKYWCPVNNEYISYYFTREFPAPKHCAVCAKGKCVQKVEYAPSWKGNVRVTHAAQNSTA